MSRRKQQRRRRREADQRLCRAFGRYLRAVRQDQKLTQESLAVLTGLSADTIRRLETGVWPRFDTLIRLSWGFGMTTSSLLEGFETGKRDAARELVALVRTASPQAIRLVSQIARMVITEIDHDGDASLPRREDHDDDNDDQDDGP